MKHFRRLTTSNESVGATDLIEEVKDASEHPAFQAMDDHTQSLLDHTEEVHQMATDSIAAVDLDEHLEQVQAIQDESASAALSLSVLPIVEALRMRHDPQAKRRSVTMESLRHNHRRGMQAVRESLGDTIAQLWHKIWEFIKKSGEFIMSLVKSAMDWVASLFTNDKASHLTSSDSHGISSLIDKIKNAGSDEEAIHMLGGRATTEGRVISMEKDVTGVHTQAQKVVGVIRQGKALFSRRDLYVWSFSPSIVFTAVSGITAHVNLEHFYTDARLKTRIEADRGVGEELKGYCNQLISKLESDEVEQLVIWMKSTDEYESSRLSKNCVHKNTELNALLKRKGIKESIGLCATLSPFILIGVDDSTGSRYSDLTIRKIALTVDDLDNGKERDIQLWLGNDVVGSMKKSKELLIFLQDAYKSALSEYKGLGELLSRLNVSRYDNAEVSARDYATITQVPKMLATYIRLTAIRLEGARELLVSMANVHNALVPAVLFLDRKQKEGVARMELR